MDSLNKNLFNRYLTKDEFDHIVGIIGDADPNDKINKQITERSSFRQANQLQPVVSKKIGSINHFMSFEDFMTRIGRTGVDTDKFDEWGNALQFNWVPPIDMDKMVNYRDYYWDSLVNRDHSIPQYITIKSQQNWSAARFRQSLKTLVDVVGLTNVASANASQKKIAIAGNLVDTFRAGEHFVLSQADGSLDLLSIRNVTLNVATGNTELETNEAFSTSTPLTAYLTRADISVTSISGNKVTVSGDFSNLLIKDYVIGINTSALKLMEIESSSFDALTNVTTITVAGLNQNNFTKISLFPTVSLMQAEAEVSVNPTSILPQGQWSNDTIGKLLWYSNTELLNGSTGRTVFGSTLLEDITKDFTAFGIQTSDLLEIAEGNKGSGLYSVAAVSPTQIFTNNQFFSAQNISYRVIRPFSVESISSTVSPGNVSPNALWFNPTNDSLYQWNGSTWNIVLVGLSLLKTLISDRKVVNYSNKNDWTADNHWVHRSQITEYTGMIRAQMPIIEYFPYIELSETSYSTKLWRYRKDVNSTYLTSSTPPKLVELFNFRYSGNEFAFTDLRTMVFHNKYGNFVSELKAGDVMRLSGFTQNDGLYTVKSVSFAQPSQNARAVSTIEFDNPIIATNDLPIGATFAPELTANGDKFTGLSSKHWEFGGITDISASSLLPEKNPMLDINVGTVTSNGFESIIGLYSQTYSSQGNVLVEPTLFFDNSLHDLVLYDDYQEGDIRVYVNGERLYGAFEDFASNINPDYVGGIRFINGYTVRSTDVIRIELGEYALADIGLRAVEVNTASGPVLYNLTNIRKIEQRKGEGNQYPYFALRDIFGKRLNLATSIFRFLESDTSPVNSNTLKRIVSTGDGTDYSFVQELKNPQTGQLYCYYDFQQIGDELQTIWKRGTYSEQYVPLKIDGQWEMPNQWYYNVSHDNYTEVKLTEIFRHFKSIIDVQSQPGLFSKTSGLFFLDDQINYGIGGTIKEHNDGFDSLVSSILVENGNPVTVIEFAKNQYDNQLRYIKERFYQEAASLFLADETVITANDLQSFITDSLINYVENNGKFDQWFGDSTSYNPTTKLGVRNWIASLPQFGLEARQRPYIVKDSDQNLYEVHCHDGHVVNVAFTPAMNEQLLRRAVGKSPSITQLVTNENVPFPTTVNGNQLSIGTYLIRTNTVAKTRKLYRATQLGVWQELDLNSIFANAVLELETRLYNTLDVNTDAINFKSVYDFSKVESNSGYSSLMEEQFQAYAVTEGIDSPLVNTSRFRQNNPFTWNYYHSPIKNDPLTGNISYNTAGTWQALYENVYGTAYPHLEPWKLQGYVNKPTWWDTEYADITGLRRWKIVMWANVFNGIVPTSGTTPAGNPGTSVPGQITNRFSYLPVNVSGTTTDDGYAPDDILPPYWNSINTSDTRVRGLYDPNFGEFVTTPQLNFEFGQNGLVEWQWKQSNAYAYDRLIVAYKLDPMRFMHQTFGAEYQVVSCLQISKETEKVFSHSDMIFHGDYQDDTNDIYRAHGLNQWYVHYNRYSGFDGVSSEFRSLWKEWETDLAYLVGAFLDTPSFRINSDFFDITTKDYEIAVKKTKGIRDVWLNSLNATAITVPSQYAKLRDQGIGWTVEFANTNPVSRPIEYFATQNYSVNLNTGTSTFRTYSYPLKSADVTAARGYQQATFNSPVALNLLTGLSNQTYTANITFNNTTTVSLSIAGTTVTTFSDLIDNINNQLGTSGVMVIENGNLVVYSGNSTSSTSVEIADGNLFNAITGFVSFEDPATTSNKFEKVFRIDGNFYGTFVDAGSIIIRNAGVFNGTYTISNVYYDSATFQTLVFVNESVTLPTTGAVPVTGVIEPVNAKTLPDEWTTGTVVYFNTTGYLPNNLDDELPYYLIRVNAREFRVAETAEAAEKGIAITPSGNAMGEVFIGNILMTFNALGGTLTDYNWRRHAVDTRYVENSSTLSISGIQQMVDFLTGFDEYSQAQGFRYRNVNGENADPVTGRNNDWQTETEKFINWLYALRNSQQETMLRYDVVGNASNNALAMTSGSVPNWANGTAVVLLPQNGSTLPPEFDNPLSSTVPYYVIRVANNTNEFKLAATAYDAAKGNAITLTGNGSGTFQVMVYKAITKFPSYELNPFKNYIWINHETGVLANVLDDDYTDPMSASRLFDNNLLELNAQNVLVFREDKESRISLTGDSITNNESGKTNSYMAGMHLFFDGFEHMIRFEDRSVDNSLIYDSFFGLNTPRFYVEFDRQQDFTLRPNVGGFFMSGSSLVQNFESTVNDMRYYYDSVKAPEGRATTDLVRQSLGYDGAKEYMDDLKINPKTQFQFWQGMIQNKGTNKAVTAFVNQDTFDTALVDEFWAYKVAEFGDNKERNHIEMKLLPSDVVKNELRVEFIAPENTAVDSTFTSVALTDLSRWWNQPDQIQAMSPNEAFFFNAKVVNYIADLAPWIKVVNGKRIFQSPSYYMDAVVVTYFNPLTKKTVTLNEGLEYKFLNAKIIEFMVDLNTLPTVSMSMLSYDYDSQNPAKVIDKDAGQVVATLPIWNPAMGHYFDAAYYAVDLHRPTDPAIYTNSLDGSDTGNATWKNNHVGTVWLDNKLEQYVPYYDKTVYPSTGARISRWGKLAPWAEINLYQWTRTLIAPEDYDEIARRQSYDMSIADADKETGTTYKRLYLNSNALDPETSNLDPFWVEVKDTHYDFTAGLSEDSMNNTLGGKVVEVYINAVYRETIEFEDGNAVRAYFTQFNFGDYCHVIARAEVPTSEQLEAGVYRYFTPHTIEKRFDVKSGQTYNVYYYWVTDKKQPLSDLNPSVSLYSAKRQLTDMSEPYIILQGLRTPDFGYGLIFGHVFDEFAFNLPYRYTQMVAKGLHGTVKDNNRSIIRFTRDFTLRDKLDADSITPKNRHEEWKLFREQQLEKVDRYLWNKITEALIGFRLSTDYNSANTNKPIPSLNRILFDRLYQADTQYGLGDQQVFTNKDLSRDTIISVLSNPNTQFEYVNIEEFLSRHNFATPEDIIQAMNEIYVNFSVSEVNKIFFAVLHDAMSLKMEHAEIFKTSWVGLQISKNVVPSIAVPYDELRLVPGPDCATTPPAPSPTPSPTSTPNPSTTPTPTPSPTPSNNICGGGVNDRVLEESEGRITEDGECRTLEPNAVPVTPTPTPSPRVAVTVVGVITIDSEGGYHFDIGTYCGSSPITSLQFLGDSELSQDVTLTCGGTALPGIYYAYNKPAATLIGNEWYTANIDFPPTAERYIVRTLINGNETIYLRLVNPNSEV
ncbi:hypothetical protein Xoosp13_296 [Xanthomonas phage Xoo-sp13]|nr:hypothetical protein Xoosp13_296 [Xanthomonas phage Xoo-sp13]